MGSKGGADITIKEQGDGYLVEPAEFAWSLTKKNEVVVYNGTKGNVLVWFPSFDRPWLKIPPHKDRVVRHDDIGDVEGRTEIQYAVYLECHRKFAEGNSAPRMIIDP